jgi:mono/diheme cytochrome c family protein
MNAVRASALRPTLVGLMLVGALASCGKGGEAASDGASAAAPAPDTTAMAAPVSLPEGVTPAMVALGDSIFHGEVAGGICFTCHGADAKGTPLAPPLVAHQWLTGDGSYAFIQKRVTEGMPTPTPPYPTPMLPKGGANLTPEQVQAVAAYVYSISRQ